MAEQTGGSFVISLDFELLWGVRDIMGPEVYGEHILGVFESFPRMLELFDHYGIKATFATVGFLFADSLEEMQSYFPESKPSYLNPHRSPYNGHFQQVGTSEQEDRYHFATSLMELLRNDPDQEIGTHTFSHYYCLEEGQTAEQFRADIQAAVEIARSKGIELKSLVFPRNQMNATYLRICSELGIETYRGNENSWYYNKSKWKVLDQLSRMLRLSDSYLNLSGHNTHNKEKLGKEAPYNIPSSRFLRPFNPYLKAFEGLRLRRILRGMEHAAKEGELYHLWWHPHNFGKYQNENLLFLEKILQHYQSLSQEYNFRSKTMREVGEEIKLQVHA